MLKKLSTILPLYLAYLVLWLLLITGKASMVNLPREFLFTFLLHTTIAFIFQSVSISLLIWWFKYKPFFKFMAINKKDMRSGL
jgi:hypothetical protein